MTGSSEILGGGFGLLARRPAAVAAWAVIFAVLGMAAVLFVLPHYATQIEHMMTIDPQSSNMAAMQGMNGLSSLSWGLALVGYFVAAVVMCGAFRATMRPEEPSFALLRVGWEELYIFGIIAVLSIAAPIAIVIFALIVALLGFLIGFATSSVPVLQVLLIVLLAFAAVAALIYVWVRISLMFPLTFLRRKLVIDEAWTLSRGRFWTLFLPYLLIFVIVAVLSMLIMVPVLGSVFHDLPSFPHGQDPEAARAFMLELVHRWFSQPFGMMGAMVVLGSIVRAVSVALYGGAMATAAQGFLADDGKLPLDAMPGDPGGN